MTRALDALRVLLGAVMVITAIQYFMPFLLGFLPRAAWHDPLAVRLLTAFDKSGLYAVAKFIHLVGGMLLLSNRAVPFALTAILPVNLCGAFIAVIVEADPLLATLAVLTIALNGLLMLAYLPAYSGVLEGGHLADGEAPEAGRNYESLFANPLANAPPSAYPKAAAVLAAALAFFWFVVPGLNSMTGIVTLAVPTLVLAVGWIRALTGRQA
jgi:putative oxidoreductase